MKCNGTELKEFTSERPVVFDPPKEMLVWDNNADDPVQTFVHAYVPQVSLSAITDSGNYTHCAEIPEAPKPRRATEMELARWIAQGNGCFTNVDGDYCWTSTEYDGTNPGKECNPDWRVRKWDDSDWHEPTPEYMWQE